MSTRHIVYMPLSALTPANRNPKDHDLPAIIASLRRFGWVEPAVVDERTAKLLGGHGRREAAVMMMQAGDPPPAGVFVDDDGDWLVPVVRGIESRNDTEAEALIIALGKIGESGGWLDRTLAEMVEDVLTADAPLIEALGMDDEAVDDLLRKVDPESLSSHTGDEKPSKSSIPDPDPHLSLADADTEESVTFEAPDPLAQPSRRTVECPACGHEVTV